MSLVRYITILVELSRVEGGTEHGRLIAQQLLDVAIRVEAIRTFVTRQMVRKAFPISIFPMSKTRSLTEFQAILLENSHLFLNNSSVSEVLYAAAWICGEFAEYVHKLFSLSLSNNLVFDSQIPSPKSTLLHLLTTNAFPAHITAVFLQNASKILSKLSKEKNEEFCQLCDEMVEKYLPHFLTNEDLEVQERASSLLQIIQIIKSEDLDICQVFFAYALNPVAAKAQRKVPVPIGLDLDLPFVELDDSDSEEERIEEMTFVDEEEEESVELTEEQVKKNMKATEERKAQMEKNPNYLKARSKKKKALKKAKEIELVDEVAEEAEEVVVNNVNQMTNSSIPGLISSQNFLKKTKPKKKTKKKSKKSEEEEEEPEVQHTVTIKGLEMPEGVELNEADSDEDTNLNASDDPHRALAKITFNETDFAIANNVQKHSKRPNLNLLDDKKKKTKKTSKKDKTSDEIVEKKEKKKKKTKTEDSTKENNIVITETNESNLEVISAKKKAKKADRPKSLELNGEKKKKKKTKSKISTVLEPTEETESERKRDEYEETAGIETPSLFVPLTPSTQSDAMEPPVVPSVPTKTTTED